MHKNDFTKRVLNFFNIEDIEGKHRDIVFGKYFIDTLGKRVLIKYTDPKKIRSQTQRVFE